MKLPAFTNAIPFENRDERKAYSANTSLSPGIMPSGDCGCGGDDKCVGQCVTLPLAPGPSCLGQCIPVRVPNPFHW